MVVLVGAIIHVICVVLPFLSPTIRNGLRLVSEVLLVTPLDQYERLLIHCCSSNDPLQLEPTSCGARHRGGTNPVK